MKVGKAENVGVVIVSKSSPESVPLHHLPQRLHPPSILGFSFMSLGNVYYGQESSVFHIPFIRNKICYFSRHGIPFLLKLQSSEPGRTDTFSKIASLQIALQSTPTWLFYSDLDVVFVNHSKSLLDFLVDDRGHIVFNDHNAAINNGAMFLRRSHITDSFLKHWSNVLFGRVAPFLPSSHYPYTDNGAVWEAMAQVAVACKHINCSLSYADAHFAQSHCCQPFSDSCYHKLFAESAGPFTGVGSRFLPGEILLSHSIGGFNNHVCRHPLHEAGMQDWDLKACFSDESAAVHTKTYSDWSNKPGTVSNCSASLAFEKLLPLRPGSDLLFFPDSSSCVLENVACSERLRLFYL